MSPLPARKLGEAGPEVALLGLGWIAHVRGPTVAQVAIAWVLGRGDDIVPLVGARTRERLDEALGATAVELGDAQLERAVPPEAVAGDRYREPQMAMLDSERV